jgi:hypothetical protein
MSRPEVRHYTEEELLLHALGDEAAEAGKAVETHFGTCPECAAVFQEYRQLVRDIRQWEVPELTVESWLKQSRELLHLFRSERSRKRMRGPWIVIGQSLAGVWDYALANPLPALGYIVAAVAFASERTISVFHLDRVLPATTELFKFIRQVL